MDATPPAPLFTVIVPAARVAVPGRVRVIDVSVRVVVVSVWVTRLANQVMVPVPYKLVPVMVTS